MQWEKKLIQLEFNVLPTHDWLIRGLHACTGVPNKVDGECILLIYYIAINR